MPAHDAEVLLDEQHRRQLGEPLEHAGDVGDERGRETLRRLVDEQHAVVVQERARDRDHLLLAAGERSGALLPALLELREELVDEVVARLCVALGEAEVLCDREAGEDVAVLRHVADAAADDPMRRHAGELLVAEADGAAPVDEAEDRAQRRRLADAVASEQSRDAALRHVERHALQHVRLPEIDVQVADGEERPAGDRAHSSSPRYADCTVGFAITAAGVSQARSAPWCMTAMRCARPVTTSMWCSTISTVLLLFRVNRTDQLDELRHVLGGEPGHRLVEKQDRLVRGEQHRDLEPPLVAVRERAGASVRVRLEADARDAPRAPVRGRLSRSRPAARGGACRR